MVSGLLPFTRSIIFATNVCILFVIVCVAKRTYYVISKVQVSQPLLAPIDSKSGIIHHVNNEKIDVYDEEKGGGNANLPHACFNVEHIGVANLFSHSSWNDSSVLYITMNVCGTTSSFNIFKTD